MMAEIVQALDIRADDAWEENGPEDDPRARLLMTVYILHVPHFLEAIEVAGGGDYQGPTLWSDENGTYEHICAINGDWHHGLQVVDIEDRAYVLTLSPYSQ